MNPFPHMSHLNKYTFLWNFLIYGSIVVLHMVPHNADAPENYDSLHSSITVLLLFLKICDTPGNYDSIYNFTYSSVCGSVKLIGTRVKL